VIKTTATIGGHMPKYSIQVIAEVEVVAPNVLKAFDIAEKRIRVSGQHSGSKRDKNDRDMWNTELKVKDVHCRKPFRIDT